MTVPRARNDEEPVMRAPRFGIGRWLENANVLGTRTLRSTALVVRDLLSLAQVFEPHALYGGHVKEHVGSRRIRDESKTLIRQTLDRTFRHRCTSSAAVVVTRFEEPRRSK